MVGTIVGLEASERELIVDAIYDRIDKLEDIKFDFPITAPHVETEVDRLQKLIDKIDPETAIAGKCNVEDEELDELEAE